MRRSPAQTTRCYRHNDTLLSANSGIEKQDQLGGLKLHCFSWRALLGVDATDVVILFLRPAEIVGKSNKFKVNVSTLLALLRILSSLVCCVGGVALHGVSLPSNAGSYSFIYQVAGIGMAESVDGQIVE